MERMTDKAWGNLDPWECCGQDNYCKRGCHEEGGCNNGCIVPKLYRRLAIYEDTGLAPAEYLMRKDEIRVLEMFKEQSSDAEEAIKIAEARRDGRLLILPCKPEDMVWRICGQRGKKHVAQRRVESIEYTASGEIWIHSTACDVFGKTVFLTREEAEAALKGENK